MSTLKAGAMYCAVLEGEWGELFWYASDGCFYDADTGEEVHPVYDELIQQSAPYNIVYQ